jgi:predicted metalloprotease with PDZ domain
VGENRYLKYLGYAGLEVELPKELDEADLGATVRERDGKLFVWSAGGHSAAGRAGIAPRDVILALDGVTVDAAAMKKIIDSKKPGDTVTVRFSRGGGEKEVSVVLAKKIDPGYRIKRIPNPSPDQEMIYQGWIGRGH